jgi:glutathione peroxidase
MMLSSIALLTLLNMNTEPVKAKSIYDFTMNSIDGKATSLKKFQGKVLLVVNVASKCGLTPQYEGLQAVYDKYKEKGLVILGFPANNFGGQEPGTNEEIKTFCSTKYNVSFPMFSKVSVKGDDITPLYKWLIEETGNNGDIEWDFGKFVVGRDGKTISRFSPRLVPGSKEVVTAIEAALAIK